MKVSTDKGTVWMFLQVVLYLIPKGARFEINHNCHASVLLADRLPYALS